MLKAYSEDEERDERGRWSSGGGSGSSALTAHGERVYSGTQEKIESDMTKQQVGALGEKVTVEYLKSMGLHDAAPLNMHTTNFPVDLVGDHQLFEVKTGLVSNGRSAQQWRATIGEPGPTEKAWLKGATPKQKAEWNDQKRQAIMDRKNGVVRQFSRKLGVKVQPFTVGLIVNPDKKTVDIHMIKGFHSRVGWNSDVAKKSYVGTYKYA